MFYSKIKLLLNKEKNYMPDQKWTECVSWTRRLDGPQVLEPTSTRYISRGVGCPTGTVRHSHALRTLAPIQSSHRTGPSSPPPELLLARVDTGRGDVRSALRRSRDWIGCIRSWDCTASIIRNRASSGNPRGLLPKLDLGFTCRKSFVYLLAPQQV